MTLDDRQNLRSAVRKFSEAMQDKLLSKEKAGWYGWDESRFSRSLKKRLPKHVDKLIAGDTQQAIDVANIAMFLWAMERDNDA